jgi:hypothetical protein
VCEAVLEQIAAVQNRIDQRETCPRPIPHRHRDRTIELDDRRRIRSPEKIVQLDDLVPIRFTRGARVGVNSGNGSLYGIRTEPPRA